MSSSLIPLRDLTAIVRPQLDQVTEGLLADLRPEQEDLVPFVTHAASYRGKQLRAALVFLAPRALGLEETPSHVQVAKIIELLHTATLVHDDVLDGAALRRKVPTINELHGPEIPVLLGDYIYARAFHMSVQLEDPTCSRVLADITRRICQGEITQIVHRFDYGWTVDRYDAVIRDKTALLYGAACRLGAYYAGAPEEACSSLETFGVELGMAFQIVDDCLDLDGDEEVVGKSLGTDLGKGKLTLPLLRLMSQEGARESLQAIMEADAMDAEKVVRLRKEFDVAAAIEHSRGVAQRHIDVAVESIANCARSPAHETMVGLAEYVLARRR